MKRSERLYKEGKIDVYVGSWEIATIVKDTTKLPQPCRYIGTDFDALCNGLECSANCYEDRDGKVFAIVEFNAE